MKKIAFNALGLKSGTGGVESYIYNVIKYVLKNDCENEYLLYVGKNTSSVFDDLKCFKNFKIIVFPINTNNSTIRVITEYTILTLSLIKHKINLVHHFCNYMPRFCPVKSITTLHDLSGFFYHENFVHTKQMERFYKHLKREMGYTFKHAKKVIVISEFTRAEVHKYYNNVDNNKLITIGMSLDTRKENFIAKQAHLKDFDISKKYLLSVSVVRPHKNYAFLVRVFNLLKEKYNIPYQLVIAGGIQVNAQDFFEEIEKSPYKYDIKYLGYVPNEKLTSLYTYADIYLTTTLYEGFGIPLMEAMTYNLPIACSNVASLPEVGREGAVYFNPKDENNACEVIYNLILDKNLQELIKSKNKENLKYYSWDKVASNIINLYKDIF